MPRHSLRGSLRFIPQKEFIEVTVKIKTGYQQSVRDNITASRTLSGI
jgi:hypothetical protein